MENAWLYNQESQNIFATSEPVDLLERINLMVGVTIHFNYFAPRYAKQVLHIHDWETKQIELPSSG